MKDIAFVCLLAAIVANVNANAHWAWFDDPELDPCLTNTSCGCCMQKQMDNMESSFNQSLHDMETSLKQMQHVLDIVRANRNAFSVALTDKVSCFGDPSLPSTTHAANRSMFSVALTNKESYCYGTFRKEMVVFYEHEFINQGDVYNTNTGVFTVPHSGVYSLALTVFSDAEAGAGAAVIMIVNNKDRYPSEINKPDEIYKPTTTVLALELNAGDRVSVIMPIGYQLCDYNSDHFNTFSGFMLHGDGTYWN